MTQIRVEFGIRTAGGGFSQLGAAELVTVTGTATAAGDRPVAPAGATLARLSAVGAAVIAAIGADPTADAASGTLVVPGERAELPLAAGQKLSFIEGPDISETPVAGSVTLLTDATADGNGAAADWIGGSGLWVVWGTWNGASVKLQYSPDGEVTWIDVDGAVLTADGGLPMTLLPSDPLRCVISSAGASTSLSSEMKRARP